MNHPIYSPCHRKDVETVIHSDNAFATVAYLRIKDAELIPKENTHDPMVAVPPLLEDEFISVRDAIQAGAGSSANGLEVPKLASYSSTEPTVDCLSSQIGNWVSVSNVQPHLSESNEEVSLEEEVVECFSILQRRGNISPPFPSHSSFQSISNTMASTFPTAPT
jgi:diphthine-ammonia ligase